MIGIWPFRRQVTRVVVPWFNAQNWKGVSCIPLGGKASFTPSGYIHIHNNQFKVLVGVTFPCYPTNYVPGYPVWISIRMRQPRTECATPRTEAARDYVRRPSALVFEKVVWIVRRLDIRKSSTPSTILAASANLHIFLLYWDRNQTDGQFFEREVSCSWEVGPIIWAAHRLKF